MKAEVNPRLAKNLTNEAATVSIDGEVRSRVRQASRRGRRCPRRGCCAGRGTAPRPLTSTGCVRNALRFLLFASIGLVGLSGQKEDTPRASMRIADFAHIHKRRASQMNKEGRRLSRSARGNCCHVRRVEDILESSQLLEQAPSSYKPGKDGEK
jgi:hypothetical protein